MTTDLVVVGSGIAGLYAALLASSQCRVLLVTKGALEESNTRYAQGGIAVALHPADSPELHLRDTISAGDGICDPNTVSLLTHEAPACIRDLIRLGVPFDRDGADLAWTLEAAHSRPRVLHAGGDATGARIESVLSAAVLEAGVSVMEDAILTRLVTSSGSVTGVELIAGGEQMHVLASSVILATGGVGQLFARTTNPAVATGDGIAAAFRAGAELMDLEFTQFHPTALAVEGAPSFLISEAVRGEGGVLRNASGVAFMARYHPDRELAPRDVVARAIHQEMVESGSPAVLDVTHLDSDLIERRFPNIVAFCRTLGIDPVHQPIPVAPAAHYLMGGIRTDSQARTTLPGLLACGEAACTAVHGANRLASNSLLEGLVFARRAVQTLTAAQDHVWRGEPSAAAGPPVLERRDMVSREVISDLMWREAGLVRSAGSLARAAYGLETLGAEASPEGPTSSRQQIENRSLHVLAQLVASSAMLREESRGAHYRSDFPKSEPEWRGHIVQSNTGSRYLPVSPPLHLLKTSWAR